MWSIYQKELISFFNTLLGYIVLGVFFLFLGLMIWVFPDTGILESNFATLDPLFTLTPFVFLFLIPAITMRSFAEENQTGTLELLLTRPVSATQLVLAKFLAALTIVALAVLLTSVYFYTIFILKATRTDLDTGAILGSYFGLLLLGAVFSAAGIFCSSLTSNQIVAFVLGAFVCFLLHWGFYYFSNFPLFVGRIDDLLQALGVEYHYRSISRGVVDSRDIIYFLSVIALFLLFTEYRINTKR